MTPTETIIGALRDGGCDPKQSGSGWAAKCPAHDDRTPRLSIGTGEGGRALVHCQAGCDTSGVLKEIGSKQSDLFAKPTTNGTAHRNGGASKPMSPAWATLGVAASHEWRGVAKGPGA